MQSRDPKYLERKSGYFEMIDSYDLSEFEEDALTK